MITEFNPFETGLSRFVTMGKEFIGRDALQLMMRKGLRKQLVSLVIDCDHAPSHGGASVYQHDQLIGTVTSAQWGHRTSKNIALAFIDPDYAAIGTSLMVDVLGIKTPATVVTPTMFDPENSRLKPAELMA